MNFRVVLEISHEGVSVPELPGCHSQGAIEQEALENIKDAIQSYLDVKAELDGKVAIRFAEVAV